MHAIFNTIFTRNQLVAGFPDLNARGDNGYAELAVWLINNWNFEEKAELWVH